MIWDKRDLKMKYLAKKKRPKKKKKRPKKRRMRVGKVCNFIIFIQFIKIV
jgi:hypothetical protein